jgi:hypothetical protein
MTAVQPKRHVYQMHPRQWTVSDVIRNITVVNELRVLVQGKPLQNRTGWYRKVGLMHPARVPVIHRF